MEQLLEVTLRSSSSNSEYLVIGGYKTDAFGDKRFVQSKFKYPDRDSRLKVKKIYERRSTLVKIIVPNDYPLVILKKSSYSSGDQVVYSPATK